MKYLSLALALFVCEVVVYAAPSSSSSSSPPPEEFAFNPLDKINQKIQEFYEKFVCVRNVIEKAVDKTEFQQDYEEFKEMIETLFEGAKNCENLKCKFDFIMDSQEYFADFFKAISTKHHELGEMIQKETQKCFTTPNMFGFAPTKNEYLQCVTDVLDQVSKDDDLEELWAYYHPIIQTLVNDRTKCPNAGNIFLVNLCKIGTLYDFYRHVMEYVYSASKENPQAMRDFSSGVAQKCGGQAAYNELDIMLPMKSFGIVDKLKCVIKALGKAVEDTDYESVYDELKKELEEVLHNIEACKEQSGVLGKTKCVYDEIKLANGKIINFLRSLYETHGEAYERAREYIGNCLA